MNEMMACKIHKEMQIVYRCDDHCVCLCTLCRVDTHRNCDHVIEIGKSENAEKDVIKIQENLAKLGDTVLSLRKGKEENKASLYQNHTEIVDEYEEVIQQAIDKLEELKVNFKSEAREQLRVAVSEIAKDIENIEMIEKTITRNQDLLQAASKYGGEDCQNVVANLLANIVKKHKDAVGDLQSKDKVKLKFDRNPNSIVVSSPGSISVVHVGSSVPKTDVNYRIESTSDEISEDNIATSIVEEPQQSQAPVQYISLPLVEESFDTSEVLVNVSEPSDKNRCSIFGAVVLSNSQLVLIDYDNSKIKLLSADFFILHSLRLPGKPVRMCAISDNKVAVSFERVKRINRYVVDDNMLTYEGGFPTTLFPHGIAFNGNHLMALMSDEDFSSCTNAKDDTLQVEIRNPLNGKVIDIIEDFKVVGKKSWSLVLNDIQAINFTEDGSMIIAERNRVLCFDIVKKSRKTVAVEKRFYVCSGEIVKNDIENITSDRDSIFACLKSGKVLQLSAIDYSQNSVIVSDTGGGEYRSVTVDKNRMILGCNYDDNIQIYTFRKQ